MGFFFKATRRELFDRVCGSVLGRDHAGAQEGFWVVCYMRFERCLWVVYLLVLVDIRFLFSLLHSTPQG